MPTDQSLHFVLCQNILQHSPVTPSDVDRAFKIFGPKQAALKGKSVRTLPPIVPTETIDIPWYIIQTHRSVELCIDMLFLCKLGMLAGIDRSIRYRSLAVHVKAMGACWTTNPHDIPSQ